MASPCKRWELLVLGLVSVMAAWAYVVAGAYRLPVPTQLREATDAAFLALPGWALMTLGCYALFSIGHALFVFRDTPEASAELDLEVVEAKKFYSDKAKHGKLAFEVGSVPEGEGNGIVGMNE